MNHSVFAEIIIWKPYSQDELLSLSEGRTNQRPVGVAKCDDVEVKRLLQNVVITVVPVPEIDKAIQTVVATLS